MAITIDLFVVGSIIILGLISQFLFKKLRIPSALQLIVFGGVLSWFKLAEGVKSNEGAITFLVVFSLIYVVFYGALPIRLKAIFSTLRYAFLSAILNFIVITGLVGGISYLMGFGPVLSLSLGALFCVLDGSIINSLLEMIRVSKKAEAQVQAESTVIDIFVIVGVLTFVNFARIGFENVLSSLSSYIFLGFGIGLFAAFVWAFALKHVGGYSSAPIATMAMLVMLYAFAEFVHSNGVIAVFTFSIVLGNASFWSKLLYKDQKEKVSMLNFHTKSFFKDISFLVRTFLFVYLGILVDFVQWPYLLVGLGFFLLAYIIRSFIMRLVYNKELSQKELHFIDVMCAKGLTPVVMLAAIRGTGPFANIIIGGIFSSVILTSVAVFLVEKNRFSSVSQVIIAFFSFVFRKKRAKEQAVNKTKNL